MECANKQGAGRRSTPLPRHQGKGHEHGQASHQGADRQGRGKRQGQSGHAQHVERQRQDQDQPEIPQGRVVFTGHFCGLLEGHENRVAQRTQAGGLRRFQSSLTRSPERCFDLDQRQTLGTGWPSIQRPA